MRTVAEYEVWLAGLPDLTEEELQSSVVVLRREALERMRVNVGLLAENEELRRRVQRCEEGQAERS